MAFVKAELDKEKILSFLREHKEQLYNDFGVTKIALFGSYARGEQGPESDVDLGILSSEHTLQKRADLKRFLEENLGRPVDVCNLKYLRAFIRRSIEEDIVYA